MHYSISYHWIVSVIIFLVLLFVESVSGFIIVTVSPKHQTRQFSSSFPSSLLQSPSTILLSSPSSLRPNRIRTTRNKTTMSASDNIRNKGDGKFHFAIDRGGTFTDVFCQLPDGKEIVRKLLSVDPSNYPDAPTEGIRRVLAEFDQTSGAKYERGDPVVTSEIGSIRMGTTVATNALLERQGARMAWIVTKGFEDLLEIGNQARPDIFGKFKSITSFSFVVVVVVFFVFWLGKILFFVLIQSILFLFLTTNHSLLFCCHKIKDLTCHTPSLLYERVVGIDERVLLKKFVTDTKVLETLPCHTGITNEEVLVEKAPDMSEIQMELEKLKEDGITSIAISLLHAYTYTEHEKQIVKLAESMGCFEQISASHQVMPMVKLLPRSHTSCAAAYLTPQITNYLASFQKGFDDNLAKNVPLQFMKSDGGLAPVNDFGGHQAILSGPAGGVVGYAKTTYGSHIGTRKDNNNDGNTANNTSITPTPVIGFDMVSPKTLYFVSSCSKIEINSISQQI